MTAKSPAAGVTSPGDRLIRAAVLSVFDIDWIQPHLGEAEVDEVADFLSTSCERVIDSTGTPRWQLRDTERMRVLRTVPRASLRAAIDSLPTRPREPAQAALEQYASESFPPVEQLDAAALSGVLQLERWVGPGAGLPAPSDVQARLDWVTLTEPLQRLVARGFFGRQDLLAALRSFIAGQVSAAEPAQAFLIEGVGGSGKSTALARLVLDLPLHEDVAVYIGFDRGWLTDGGPWALFDEIVRQVGVHLTDHRPNAGSLRRQAQKLAGRAGGFTDVASRGSQQQDLVDPALLGKLATLVADRGRLVVVLDTLEELARRDESLAYALFSFLADLCRAVPQTRIIAAGRSLPYAALVSGRLWHLTGLDDTDALRLMRTLTASAQAGDTLLREIIRLLGGNPLSLHLAADVLQRTGKNPTRLIAVAEGNIQGQLYSRLLEHIRDPLVRAIAHPGLVVRRLTPAIIQGVLAEPCGIAPLDEAEAARIFWALRREATLCEPSPDGDGALVHRQDVRALMLPSIQRDSPGTTHAIHEAAVRHYEAAAPGDAAGPGPDTVARREELYHRLMLTQERTTLDRRWLPAVAADLAAVMDELPPRSQLYLTTRVRGLRLEPAARAEADDDEWQHAVRPAAMLRMERGQVSEALELVRERRGTKGRPLLPDLEIEALERLGHVQEALSLARRERRRAARQGAVEQVRALISQEARVLERTRQWSAAWRLLAGLAALDRDRRNRTAALDEEVRIRELIVLTSLLRIARHQGRSDPSIGELTRETVSLAEATPPRLLTANPSLLRDLAAEIGRHAPGILQLGVSALTSPAPGVLQSDVSAEDTRADAGPAGHDAIESDPDLADDDDEAAPAEPAGDAQPAMQHEAEPDMQHEAEPDMQHEADEWSGQFTDASDAAQDYLPGPYADE